MKVTFELSPKDIHYFRERLKRIRQSLEKTDESVVLRGAENMMREARASESNVQGADK